MNEVTLRNEDLGLSMTKATINGIDVVLAENVREALEWDSVPHMVRELKDGKEVLKMCVSALKSVCWNFAKFEQVKRNTAMSPLSYTRRCAQDDCDCQPKFDWGWEGDGHHHQGRPCTTVQAELHHVKW